MGYVSRVESGFVCNPFGTCATVNNIVARLEGADKTAVLLAAHYDSVPAGPGASDDGVGVAAVLEFARALKSRPVPRHSVVLLIDDGEEAGLLGAREFVQSDPWAKDVRAVVNLDARGTSGPSLMFETGSANAWAARLYARSVPHPATSSVFYTVYKQLPNDTDFTVFKAAGYEGLNFAFIDNVVQYHTPVDNLANVNPASVQHQGDNALHSLLALANADLSRIAPEEAVYFDVFGRRTVRLPARWMPALGIATIFLIGFEIGLLLRARRLDPRQFLRGLCASLLIVAGTATLGFLLQHLMQLSGALPVNWIAHPAAIQFTFWFLAISVAITLAVLFAPSCGFWGLWSGVWTWWALLSLAAVWTARGTSYVLLIPAALAAVSALPGALLRSGQFEEILTGSAVVLPLAASGIVGFPIALLLYDGLGNRALPGIAALIAFLFTPMLPLCVDFLKIKGVRGVAIFWTPVVVAFAAGFAALLMPPYSAKAPERVNIEYWKDADTGKTQWIVDPASGRLPDPLLAAASFRHADKGPFPWDAGPAFFAPAPGLDNPAPTLTILESTRRCRSEKLPRAPAVRARRAGRHGPVSARFECQWGAHQRRGGGGRLQPEPPPVRGLGNLPLPHDPRGRRGNCVQPSGGKATGSLCARRHLRTASRRQISARRSPLHRSPLTGRRRDNHKPPRPVHSVKGIERIFPGATVEPVRLGQSAVDDVNLGHACAHVFVAAEATTHKDATATPKRMSGYGHPMRRSPAGDFHNCGQGCKSSII